MKRYTRITPSFIAKTVVAVLLSSMCVYKLIRATRTIRPWDETLGRLMFPQLPEMAPYSKEELRATLSVTWIDDCVSSSDIPSNVPIGWGNEGLNGAAGRTLYCLSSHPLVESSAMYFIGYAGAGGAFSMAAGSRKRVAAGLTTHPLIIAEMVPERREHAEQLFDYYNMSHLVDMTTDRVSDNEDWLRSKVCPEGRPLSLFAADLDCLEPQPYLWLNILRVCKPKLFFMENSGYELQAPPFPCGCGGSPSVNADCRQDKVHRGEFHRAESWMLQHGYFKEIGPDLKYSPMITRRHSQLHKVSDPRTFSLYKREGVP